MDPKATEEWTSCEGEEFKALFAELWNEKSCDRMEALAKRFPAKSIQQLRDKHDEVFVDMLFGEINGEPSGDYASSDWHDWYKLLEGDTHDSVLAPLVETSLFEPSKELLFEAPGDQEEMQKSHRKSSRKRRQFWTAEEHRSFILYLFYLSTSFRLYFTSRFTWFFTSLCANSIKDAKMHIVQTRFCADL